MELEILQRPTATCIRNDGSMLAVLLTDMQVDLYDKNALGQKAVQTGAKTRHCPGFATAFDGEGKPTEHVEHDAFKRLLYKWHMALNTALRSCLDGLDWMHIRNAITVLKSFVDFFPAVSMAEKVLKQLAAISERETASKTAAETAEQAHRSDLAVPAQTAMSALQKRRPNWILVPAFRDASAEDCKDEQRAASAKASCTPRAAAPDVKPITSARAATGVEDGEVTKNGLEAGRPSQASEPTNRKKSSKDSLPPKPPLPSQEPSRPANTGALPTRAAVSASMSAGKATTPNNPAAQAPASRAETGVNRPTPPPLKGLPAKPVPLPPRTYTDEYGQLRVDNREQRPPRDSKDPIDGRDPREQREGRESREQPARDSRELHGPRDVHARDLRAAEAAGAYQTRDLGTPGRRASDVAEPRAPDGSVQEHAWSVAERSERAGRNRPARPELLRRNDAKGVAERDSRQTREQAPGRAHETRPPRNTAKKKPDG